METPRWHTREDSGILLDRDGRWWHDGEPIEHPKIVELFNTSLKPTEDGRYQLVIGKDWCFVEVEGAAYGVLAIDVTPADQLFVRLTDRTAERLDPATLELDAGGVLNCRVKSGRARARFSRDAQFAIGELLEELEGRTLLRVGGVSVEVPVKAGSASGVD